jgi:hypothetical protein
MTLLEDVKVEFIAGKLDVYQNGSHVVSQPFNSSTESRAPFASEEEALAWLEAHYPGFYQQPETPPTE